MAQPQHEQQQRRQPPIPVAVIGCGRMGRLHARVYSQMPGVTLVGVHDANPAAAAAVAAEYKTRPVTDLDQLLPQVNAVTIAVPTQFHLAAAEPFLRRGIACLIEKPLAKDPAEARRIAQTAHDHGALVQVGHVERFNPIVRALERLELRPRYIEATRISPMPFRSLDVGVVLDVMIHDIDIVLRLAASPVRSVDAVGVSLVGDVEDACNARLHFDNGCVATLTASRLALKTERKLRLVGRDAFVSIDYQKKTGVVVRRDGNLDTVRAAIGRVRAGEINDPSKLSYADMVKPEPLQVDDVEPLRAQADAFIDAVARRGPAVVPVEAGIAAVETAHRIMAAIAPAMAL